MSQNSSPVKPPAAKDSLSMLWIADLRWLSISILMVIGFGFASTARSQGPVTAIAFAPGGDQVLLGSQRGIEIRSWPELKLQNSLPTELVNVHDLQFSPGGTQLLAAGGSPADIGEVEVWSWPDGAMVRRIADHSDLVYRVAWSADGTRWATCSGDARCLVYDAATGEKQVTYEGHSRPVLGLGWLDAKTIVSVGLDQTVRLWDSDQGKHLRTLDNHVGSITDLAVRPVIANQKPDPAQDVLATVAEDKTVRLWQPRIGRLLRFARLDSTPRCVAWSANANLLLIGCSDGRIRMMDWENLESVSEFEGDVGGLIEIILAPAGNQCVVGGETGFRCQPAMLKSR